MAPSDAGVESARPLTDTAVPSADRAGIEAAIPVAADSAGPAVEAPSPATIDGAGLAVELAIPVPADGAADRATSDVLAPEVAIGAPDAVPDSPAGVLPEAGPVQADSAVDGGEGGAGCCADAGGLELATALPGKTLIYWVTAEWRRPDGGSASLLPAQQDFVTVTPYAKDVVVFSADGSTLQLTNLQGVAMLVAGTRASTDQGKWTYRLAYFASGELVVWSSGTAIYASETEYGSGLPVISSTRGELRAN